MVHVFTASLINLCLTPFTFTLTPYLCPFQIQTFCSVFLLHWKKSSSVKLSKNRWQWVSTLEPSLINTFNHDRRKHHSLHPPNSWRDNLCNLRLFVRITPLVANLPHSYNPRTQCHHKLNLSPTLSSAPYSLRQSPYYQEQRLRPTATPSLLEQVCE